MSEKNITDNGFAGSKPARGLMIVGTGTDIGKTYAAGLIVKKLHESGRTAGYYKAAMSGNDRRPDGSLIPGDAMHVLTISGNGQKPEETCPYVYEQAVSPHLAARLEGGPVEMDVVRRGFARVCEQYAFVTVEGSGGILCPIRLDVQPEKRNGPSAETAAGAEELWLEDIIRELNLPCLIIADAGLGTINDVVLTVSYMRAAGLQIQGIILNHFHPGDVMEEDNLRMCEYRSGCRVLACIKDGDTELDIDADLLASLYRQVPK